MDPPRLTKKRALDTEQMVLPEVRRRDTYELLIWLVQDGTRQSGHSRPRGLLPTRQHPRLPVQFAFAEPGALARAAELARDWFRTHLHD